MPWISLDSGGFRPYFARQKQVRPLGFSSSPSQSGDSFHESCLKLEAFALQGYA
jgi:hypothetical protein